MYVIIPCNKIHINKLLLSNANHRNTSKATSYIYKVCSLCDFYTYSTKSLYTVQCTIGVAKIFRFSCTFFGASLHIVEHLPEVSAKNNDHCPNLNAVLCLPLNNSTSILCSNT